MSPPDAPGGSIILHKTSALGTTEQQMCVLAQAVAPPPLRVLVAYPYMDPNTVKKIAATARELDLEFLLDCGAYTAYKQKRTISLDEYCGFLGTLPFKPWRAFALDVMGDHHATRANYDEMVRRGFADIVPVYTRGAPLSDMQHFAAQAPMFAFGGMAGTGQKPEAYIKAMAPYIRANKVHLLGFTQFDWLKWLRPYSADSSSWTYPCRYGVASIYMGRGHMTYFRPRDLVGNPPDPVMAARIARYGFDPLAMVRDKAALRGANSIVQMLTAISWVEFSMDCWAQLGTRLFLAVPAGGFFDQLVSSYRKLLEIRGHVHAA